MTSLKALYQSAPVPAKIANALLFNLSWFAILVTQSSAIALAILVVHLGLHFWFIGKGVAELRLIAGVALFGAILDQALFRLGIFNLAGQPALAPLWLACLWPVFATTLMHAFGGLQRRLLLASLVGAVGGSLSYIAGVNLSAVEFGSPVWGPVIIGGLWALVFPVLVSLAGRVAVKDDPLQAWEPAVRRAFFD